MEDEIDRVLAAVDHADAEVAELYPPYPFERAPADRRRGRGGRRRLRPGRDRAAPATRSGRRAAYGARAGRASATRSRTCRRLVGRGDGIGSNSWVVDGERLHDRRSRCWPTTRTSASRCPGSGCRWGCTAARSPRTARSTSPGFTFSGVPGVIIGHNADIAWGFTNLGPDVTDLYLERVRDGDWRYDKQWRPLDGAHRDDRGPRRRRRRAHGPLDRPRPAALRRLRASCRPWAPTRSPADEPPDDAGVAVALAWTALEPTATADAILELNLATGWDEFREAAADFAVPARTSCTPTARATSATRRRG